MQILQETVQYAVAAENGFPGVPAHKIADPQRYDDELIEKLLSCAGVKSQVVRKGIAEKERAERDRSGDAHSAKKHLGIERIRKERLIVFPIPLVDDDSIANRPKTMRKQIGRASCRERGKDT